MSVKDRLLKAIGTAWQLVGIGRPVTPPELANDLTVGATYLAPVLGSEYLEHRLYVPVKLIGLKGERAEVSFTSKDGARRRQYIARDGLRVLGTLDTTYGVPDSSSRKGQ